MKISTNSLALIAGIEPGRLDELVQPGKIQPEKIGAFFSWGLKDALSAADALGINEPAVLNTIRKTLEEPPRPEQPNMYPPPGFRVHSGTEKASSPFSPIILKT